MWAKRVRSEGPSAQWPRPWFAGRVLVVLGTLLGTLSTSTLVIGLASGTARAATPTLPSSPPLAFEAGDGNMAVDNGAGTTGGLPDYLDWASPYVQSHGLVSQPAVVAPCRPNDWLFTGGTKENTLDTTVTCGTAPPNKINLTHEYAWTQTVGGHTYLYLAWEIAAEVGGANNHIDFELNQASQPPLPAPGQHWLLNRTAGDLLVNYNVTAGGTATISLDTWDATSGTWVADATLPASAWLAAVNKAPFTDPYTAVNQPIGTFGEVGIDLTAAGLSKPNVCTNFTDVWAKTRASGSGTTAELKQFIPPTGISVDNCSLSTALTPPSTSVGGPVTDQATLHGATAAPPATVTYDVYKGSGTAACVGTPVFTDTQTVTGATLAASTPFAPVAAGTYEWQAVYDENGTTPTVASPCGSEPLVVAKATPTVATAVSAPASTALGNSWGDSATVTGPAGAVVPGGSVTFSACEEAAAGTPCATPDTGLLNVKVGAPTSTAGSAATFDLGVGAFTPPTAGTFCFLASYSGDANYTAVAGAGNTECFTVGKATPTLGTSVSAPASTALGNAWSDSATVTGPAGAVVPGGSVTFSACKETVAGTPCTTADTGLLNTTVGPPPTSTAGSSATFDLAAGAFTPPSTGTFCFLASYSGDANYTAVAGAGNTECFSVGELTPTFTTAVSAPASTTVGNAWGDSAAVTGPAGAVAPGGSVTFSACKETVAGTPCTTADTGLLNTTVGPPPTSTAGSTATFDLAAGAFTPPSAGTFCFLASYSGDATYAAVPAADNAECFAVGKATPTLGTTVSAPASTTVGNAWGDSATVTGPPAGPAPGGSVTFSACKETVAGTPCTTADTTLLNTTVVSPTSAAGSTATFDLGVGAFTPPSTGTFCFLASYSGDASYAAVPAAANAECFAVTPLAAPLPPPTPVKASPTITTVASPTTAFVGTPTSGVGDTATLTGGNDPTGSVTFTLYSDSTCTTAVAGMSGSGTVTTNAGVSTASWSAASWTPPAAGTYYWIASYAGDGSNNGFTTGCGDANEDISVLPPTRAGGSPVLTAAKRSVPAPGSTVTRGETVTYSVTLTNAGAQPATAVTVMDAVPTGTTYVAGSATCGGAAGCTATESGGTVTWAGIDVSGLSGGTPGTATVQFQVTVDSDVTNGEVIANVATFTNEGTPGCTTSTCATNRVDLTASVSSPFPVTLASGGSSPSPVTLASGGSSPFPVTLASGGSSPIAGATTAHTGEPWAGSRAMELILAGIGAMLVGIGELGRRRRRPARGHR